MFTIEAIIDYLLFSFCIFLLLGSIYITIKTRFVQIRFIPILFKMLYSSYTSKKKEDSFTILPHKALVTAMSTTLGIGTLVGPVIAIHMGGPGALIGFLLTAFFGSAATFMEVDLAVKYRKKLPSGQIVGGPMQYLKQIFSPAAAKWYAFWGCILMTGWSGAQANQLAAILDSPLLGDYRIPTYISGAVIAVLVIMTLIGGIQRISSFSAKIVPLMFVLYLGSTFWILFSDLGRLGFALQEVFQTAFSPYAMASGAVVGGVVSALRWGVFKGTQATEAGVGTQSIPHSMAVTDDSAAQGMLAMLSTYTAGILSFLSGCVALVTGTWQDPDLPMGISMVAASFHQYFSIFGIFIIIISTILFAFGTILGNSFNGSQCFGYLSKNKKLNYYYIATAVILFLGTISGVKMVWSVIDILLACIALPHMAALIVYAYKQSNEVVKATEVTLAKEEAIHIVG